MDTKEIFWVAGFLEGEGYFGSTRTTAHISAVQVQKDPIEKLHRLLGGRVDTLFREDVSVGVYYRWSLYACRAIGLMMTMFILMSAKRQEQIKKSLNKWKGAPWPGEYNRSKTVCKHGHPYSPENTYFAPGNKQKRYCKICTDASRKKYYARHRKEV